jgi:hypothetical protein
MIPGGPGHGKERGMALRHPTVWRPILALTLAALTFPPELTGQIHKSPPPQGATTHEVVPGERYRAAGFRRWFLGGGFRDIWTTPVQVPVLDLDARKGGLTVLETGGYGQSVTLEFRGADGLDYAVRSLDKDPTRRLDPLLKGTLVASIVQDQIGGFLPTAGLIVDPLLEAVGLLHPKHELVVVPDDPQLGEYREEYAGLIGMFVDRPQEGPDNTPGFARSTRISGTDTFLEELEEGTCVQADAREYLKARYIDILVGDRDRHEGQWRWARYPDGPECTLWRPIPEDRDQAFVMNDGAMMTVYRQVEPRMVKFDTDYPSLYGLTFNGWEVDRRILSELDEAVWIQLAEEVQRDLTDSVIDSAVRRLPEPHYALRGPWLEEALKSRRDALAEEALAFYRMLSEEPDVTATDRDELAVFEHLPDGSLSLTITWLDGPRSDSPWFRRTFDPDVTDEVRLYFQGGDDRAEIRGDEGNILIRIIGGGGDDTFVNQSSAGSGRVRFYDDRGDNDFDGPATVDERSFERPPATNLIHRHALDWGGLHRILPMVSYSPDVGFHGGVIYLDENYGFRKVPFESQHRVQAGMTTEGPEPFLSWDSRFRTAVGEADAVIHFEYSGINILRFYGFGNETEVEDDEEFYEVQQQEALLAPSLEWTFGYRPSDQEEAISEFRPRVRVGLGPVIKWSTTPLDENGEKFIGTLDPPPLGMEGFGQVGGRGWIEIDTRDNGAYPTSGFRILAGGSAFPSAWDAEEAFGHIEGSVSGFLTAGSGTAAPTLAFRGGGKKVFGTYPFHEAAFVGGEKNLRGFRKERFAGDGSLYGNLEVRLPVVRTSLLFPTEFGVLGAADAGRVFFEGDPQEADSWHTGIGGGIWISLLDRAQTLSVSVMRGDDLTALYFQAGLHF